MKKPVIIVVLLIIIGSVLGIILSSNKQNPQPDSTKTNKPATTAQESKAPTELTAEEVAKHNTPSDCWTIINNTVYNLTSYISRHPGGNEIHETCGKDGSTLFNERMTDDGQTVGSGEPHSRSAQAMLQSLRIGPLKN